MIVRASVAGACAVVILGATGCGGTDEPDASTSAPVAIDEVLRPAVDLAPVEDRRSVRFGATQTVLGDPSSVRRSAGLVLAAPVFPIWDPQALGIRDGRIVAVDRTELLVPATGPDNAENLRPDARLAVPTTPVTAGRAVAETFGDLVGARSEDRPRRRVRYRRTAVGTAAQAFAAVRGGTADGAIVLRSDRRRAGTQGLRVLSLPDGVSRALYAQVGTTGGSPSFAGLRRWLVGPDGQKALRKAGFDGPGPNPVSVSCGVEETC